MRHVGSEENPPCREALVLQGTVCGHPERFTSADVGTFSCSMSGKALCWDSLAGGETMQLSEISRPYLACPFVKGPIERIRKGETDLRRRLGQSSTTFMVDQSDL